MFQLAVDSVLSSGQTLYIALRDICTDYSIEKSGIFYFTIAFARSIIEL